MYWGGYLVQKKGFTGKNTKCYIMIFFFFNFQMIKFTLLNTGKFPSVNGVFSNLKDVYSSVSNHTYIVLMF